MKNKHFIIILLLAIFPTELLAQRYIDDDSYEKYHSYQRPKRKFRYAKKKYIDKLKAIPELPIDTNSVFIAIYYNLSIEDSLYSFVRFFRNGEVFFSHAYLSFPTEQEFNDLSYGKWGMYTIDKNDLIMEVYTVGFPPQYWYLYAKLEENYLKYYKSIIGRCDTRIKKNNYTSKKVKVNLTNFTINWK